MTDSVLSTLDNGVLTLTLNRPDALNAFTPQMLESLRDAVKSAADDAAVSVIVLEGAGRAFSAGVDLKVLQGVEPFAGRIGDVFDDLAAQTTCAIRSCSKPVIARVHGFCFTGALELALHCDFILATIDTKFGDTHTKWGLRPTWGMSQNLARAVGVRRARQLSFTAQTFSGLDAERWGMVNECGIDLNDLNAKVDSLVSKITAASSGAVSAAKKLYQLHEENQPLEDALIAELAMEFPQITDTKKRLGDFGK